MFFISNCQLYEKAVFRVHPQTAKRTAAAVQHQSINKPFASSASQEAFNACWVRQKPCRCNAPVDSNISFAMQTLCIFTN